MAKKCTFEGCNTKPSYNIKDEKTPIYCLKHKSSEMISVIKRYKNYCKYDGCNKIANFNISSKKIGIYCSKHKLNEMINVHSRKCIEEDCNTIPIFNMKGEKRPIYCSKHKKDGMIDICHRYCIEDDCNKLPCYANECDKYPIYCAIHKKDGMKNIVNSYCIEKDCNKHSAFNFPGINKRLYCASHKKDGMIIINGSYCLEDKCNITANYNFEGKKRGIYCNKHKKDGMIDVKNKRCKTHLCDIIASKKYNGYCIRCFIHTFPDSKITRNYKTKEMHVVTFIKEKFPDYAFETDKHIIDGCSKRRPDCLLDLGEQVIICEIDENQHYTYDCSCENKRIMEISKDINFRPLVLIRFNPDEYIDEKGNKISSCWKLDKHGICKINKIKEVEWNNRLTCLKEQIEYWIINKSDKMIEIIQLYYSH